MVPILIMHQKVVATNNTNRTHAKEEISYIQFIIFTSTATLFAAIDNRLFAECLLFVLFCKHAFDDSNARKDITRIAVRLVFDWRLFAHSE